MTIKSRKRTILIWAAMALVAATAMAWALLNAAVAQDGPVVSPAVSMEILKDINPGSPSSFPETLVEVDGVLFFSADDGTHGRELWKSDGSSPGTEMVKDIAPGPDYGVSGFDPAAAFNGELFFVADDGVTGFQPWRSDGSPEARPCLKTSVPPGSSMAPSPAI